jgi:hypothetical protein
MNVQKLWNVFCPSLARRTSVRVLAGISVLAFFGPTWPAAMAQDVPPPLPVDPNAAPAPADPNAEVLTRGPVHEAYAVPVGTGQTTGVIVPKQPANPVEEVPPDMKPDAANATWIPGYWSWDDERRDFLWVSGVWRVPPPNYRWMPGYWQEAPGQGYQRISGYWMPSHLEETTYLPQPPQSLEAGPTMAAPAQNQFWVPGNYIWRGDRYVWQPGYWTGYNPDWIWVPATYAWTPGGWVFVPGYWDYPLARRGLVFSPVYFARPVAYYRPAICVDAGVFGVSLFCRPAYGCYYYGDYYDDRYVTIGIRPWFYYNSPRVGYDPLFGYYRWYHVDRMGEREWDHHLVGWHEYYRGHPEMRPPHTWEAQQRLLASPEGRNRPDIAQLRLVGDVHVVARLPGASVRLSVVSPAERTRIQQASRESVRSEAERRQVEQHAAAGGARGPQRVSLASMPSYKAAQATSGHPVGAATPGHGPATAPGRGPATMPGRGPAAPARGNPAKPNSRDPKEKKQALASPAASPVIAAQAAPAREVERPKPAGAGGSNVATARPQVEPRTVMKPDTSKLGPPPSSRPQPPANNAAAGRDVNRSDDKRSRDKDKGNAK